MKKNKSWSESKTKGDPEYFSNLIKGQVPKVLYIGCSDSRVAVEQIMGADLGEIFVHRNIANLVVQSDLNVLSVINYAVIHLKVEHIIICGHYGCGGVQAALSDSDLGDLNPWIAHIKEIYTKNQKELDSITDDTRKNERLVELNALSQCQNISKIQAVAQAQNERKLQIHGLVFNMNTGLLIDLNYN